MTRAGGRTGLGSRVLFAASLPILFGSCAANVYLTDCRPVTELTCTASARPGTEPVVASVFLVGDAGEPDKEGAVVKGRDLLLTRLEEDLEASRRLTDEDPPDVRLAYLGDNIYPVGLRDGTGNGGSCPGADYCTRDREQLEAQIDAIPDGVTTYFLAGNHDWGNRTGTGAYRVIANQGEFLADQTRPSRPIDLVPAAGCPGPDVEDVNVGGSTRLRIIFLDTQWLLLPEHDRPDRESDPPPACSRPTEDAVYRKVRHHIEQAGDTPVLLLAHHPVRTYSSHGGHGGGAARVAHMLGWSVQDLNTARYKRLIGRLEPMLAELGGRPGGPIVFAAGHDHALQVMHDDGSRVHHLVSGSGSKLSEVGSGSDSEFSAGLPGYMRLDVLENGTLLLSVTAGCPARRLTDPLGAKVRHDGGLECTVGDFEVAFVKRLN